MKEVDLTSLFRLLWRNVLWLIAGMAVGGVLLFAYSSKTMVSSYSSTADMRVMNVSYIKDESVSGSSISASNQLAQTYAEVLKNSTILQPIADKINEQLGTTLTGAHLKGMFNYRIPEDTLIFRVTCTSGNPKVPEVACNVLCEMAPDILKKTLGAGDAQQIGKATRPSEIRPNTTMYAAIGACMGFAVVVGIILVRWLTDKTVKGKEDLADYTGVPILGEIPSFDDDKRRKRKKNGSKSYSYGYGYGYGYGNNDDEGKGDRSV